MTYYRTLILGVVLVSLIAYAQCDQVLINADAPGMNWMGRVSNNGDGSLSFDWSGVLVEFVVTGTTQITLAIQDSGNFYNIFVNGTFATIIPTYNTTTSYPFLTNLTTTEYYQIKITKRTEAQQNVNAVIVKGFQIDAGGQIIPSSNPLSRKLEFLGDSITCGYGNEANTSDCVRFNPQGLLENNYQTWGTIISRSFNAEYHIESWSGKGVVRNYADPNRASTDPFPIYFNRTIGVTPTPIYDFSQYTPDAIVINLGTNDYSTEPSPYEVDFETGYHNFIQQIRNAYGNTPPIFLACGPVIGDPCCSYVRNVVAAEENCFYIDLMNILSDDQYGCNGHPNISGHELMASVAEPVIASVMNWY